MNNSGQNLPTRRIFQIARGYKDADDADDLRTYPGFKVACDRLPHEGDLASQPTMSRFENEPNARDLYYIADVYSRKKCERLNVWVRVKRIANEALCA